MGFFDEIKSKLESTLDDLSTIEHVMIDDSTGQLMIYQSIEIEGDSLVYFGDNVVTERQLELFNQACAAASEARTGIARFIVECIK